MGSKYLKSYWRFVQNALSVELEYRGGFLFKNITGLVWVVGALFFINVVFGQVSSVGGWNRQQIICLYLTFSLAVDLFSVFVRDNLQKFLDLIRDGRLDAYLIKPINTHFLITFMSNQIGYSVLFRLLTVLILLSQYSPHTTPINWILYVLFLLIGSIAVYSVIFILHTLNIWFIRLDNITVLSHQSYELAKVPAEAWPDWIKQLLTYGYPMIVLSTFAVTALFSEPKALYPPLLVSVATTASLFVLSQTFFNFALKHYSSASS